MFSVLTCIFSWSSKSHCHTEELVHVDLGGLGVTCSPRDPRFAGSNSAEVDGFFQVVSTLKEPFIWLTDFHYLVTKYIWECLSKRYCVYLNYTNIRRSYVKKFSMISWEHWFGMPFCYKYTFVKMHSKVAYACVLFSPRPLPIHGAFPLTTWFTLPLIGNDDESFGYRQSSWKVIGTIHSVEVCVLVIVISK